MWRHERESLGSAELDEDRIVGVVVQSGDLGWAALDGPLDGDLGWAARCGRVNRRCVHAAHPAMSGVLPKRLRKSGVIAGSPSNSSRSSLRATATPRNALTRRDQARGARRCCSSYSADERHEVPMTAPTTQQCPLHRRQLPPRRRLTSLTSCSPLALLGSGRWDHASGEKAKVTVRSPQRARR